MANRTAGTQLILCGVCFAFFSVSAVPMHAQKATEQSQRSIILPYELVAGKPATLAVLTADGHVAPDTRVVFSSGEVVTTDESGRAHWLVPSDIGVVFARIPGTEVREAADVLRPVSSDSSLQVTRIPKIVSLENHFTISGHGFQGDADRNRITMNGNTIFVLASSPIQLIVMPAPNLPLGPASLTVTSGLAETVTDVTLVGITSMNSSDPQIRGGKKTEIVLLVRGTEEPLDLKVQNFSPQTVQFVQGSEAHLHTTGRPGNSAVLQLKGENAGSFSFAISLETVPVKANIPVARDFLVAAEKAATPDMANRIEEILRKLLGKRANLAKIQNDLQRILLQSGSGDFQALIRASLRAINDE